MSGTSATETQNIATVRRGYEAFARGDIETLKTLFSPGANWHAVQTGVLRGNYRGAQGILEFFSQIRWHDARRTTDNGRVRRPCVRSAAGHRQAEREDAGHEVGPAFQGGKRRRDRSDRVPV